MKKYIFIFTMIIILCISLTVLSDNTPKNIEIAPGSNKDAVTINWEGSLEIDNSKSINVKVFDETYLHKNKDNVTVTFLVFHNSSDGWGESIQPTPDQIFQGPGGYVEKTELPVEKTGGYWQGDITIIPKTTTKSISIWKNKNEGSKYYALDILFDNRTNNTNDTNNNVSSELKDVIKNINTPRELLTFMNNYFTIKYHDGMVAYTPEEFYEIKKGDCKDWALFAEYIFLEKGYKTKRLAYSPTLKPGGHVITLYWIEDKIYYLTTRADDAYIFGPYNNIEEVLKHEVKRRPDLDQFPPYYKFCPAGIQKCPPLDK
ncbi:MAG: hypothetical protein K9K32_04505 [Halanaerobiales bacterium]|nr:hypothetical protein [Halanaerobiales bacterium]